MSSADLAILLRLKDEASSEMEGVKSRFGGFGGVIAGGVAAAGAAIVAGMAIGVKAAGDLEQSVANISTIKPEIDTSAVFNSLNEMSTRIPQSSAQLGDALYNVFSSVSVNSEDALKLVETFAKGAVGAQTDAQTFGTAAMGVMNAYGIAASDAGHITDVFFNTIASGVVTGQELASSLGPVTQSAKAAGVSLDEMGAMITGVTLEGGPAAQNINNLNNFLQKVTTKEAQANLKALGLATTDATGSFRPQIDVLRDLKERLSGMSESARAMALQKIFPDAQARQGAVTLMDQLDKVDEALATNRSATGSTASAYEKMSATFNSQSKLLMNTLMSILTTVGAALLPVITPLVTAFAQWLPGAFKVTQAVLTNLGDAFLGLFAIFNGDSSFGTLTLAAGALLHIFGPETTQLILSATKIIGDAWRTVVQVFQGNWSPDASINPIVNALGMLATFVRDQVIPAVAAVASFILDQFGAVVSWFQTNWPLIQQTIAVVLGNIQAMWEAHGSQIMAVVRDAWTIVSTVIATAVANLGDLVRIAMQLITGDWAGAWDTYTSMLQRNADAWGTILGAAWNAILIIVDDYTGGAVTAAQEWMTDTTTAVSDGMQAVSDAVTNGWNAAKASVGSILPTIRDAIMSVWNAIPEDIRADLVLIATHIATNAVTWVTNLTTAGTNMVTAITGKLGEMVTAVTTWATTTFLAPITGLETTAGTAATNVGGGMLAAITGKLGEIITAVTTWVGDVLSPITGLISSAGAEAGKVGQAITDGIVGAINAGVGAIRGAAYTAARSALDAAKSALGISGGGGGGGDDGGGEDVEGRAIGGPVRSGIPYWVGERGPELFVPGLAGSILPTAALRPALAGAGGLGSSQVVNNYTVNLSGAVIYGYDDFEAKVNRAVTSGARGGKLFK